MQALARKFGPYLLLEMLLPGGTLFAFLLYLYRRSVGTHVRERRIMSPPTPFPPGGDP
jgi:hypothetical protein